MEANEIWFNSRTNMLDKLGKRRQQPPGDLYSGKYLTGLIPPIAIFVYRYKTEEDHRFISELDIIVFFLWRLFIIPRSNIGQSLKVTPGAPANFYFVYFLKVFLRNPPSLACGFQALCFILENKLFRPRIFIVSIIYALCCQIPTNVGTSSRLGCQGL